MIYRDQISVSHGPWFILRGHRRFLIVILKLSQLAGLFYLVGVLFVCSIKPPKEKV